MRRLSTVLWNVGQHGCDPFPPRLACSVHGSALHMRPSHWGVLSADERPNSRFVPWTTAEMTFWRCKWTRRPHSCTTSPRNGPESWCPTFIFHLLRRDNQPPVACAMWQARSSGKPSACPYAARSTHISHTHLAHTSRFELGSPRVSPGGCPPRPATGTVTAGLLLRQLGARCATLPLACMCLEPRAHDRAYNELALLCPGRLGGRGARSPC